MSHKDIEKEIYRYRAIIYQRQKLLGILFLVIIKVLINIIMNIIMILNYLCWFYIDDLMILIVDFNII